jgi:AGCS family alanine or glycine:cation symporter
MKAWRLWKNSYELKNKKMKKNISLFILMFPLISNAQGLDERINDWFQPIADIWVKIVLYPISFTDEISIPFVLLLLVFGALFFTIKFSFINITHFPTAINTVRGKYDELEHGTEKTDLAVDGDIPDTIKDESQDGEVSHFQALATAVSGTVGLGNIAGVALAIVLGGPGATFWMIICGLIGMSTKFVECTLGVKYRDVGEDGTVYGGPMYYLSKGLKEGGYENLGKFLAILFAILCVGASFGGGNAAQSNQAALQIADMFGMESGSSGTIIGVLLAFVVGVVIIGGIKRIASVTEKIVPFMAIIYVLACLFIILSNFSYIDDAFGLIFSNAFSMQAGFGGLIGVLIVGFQRAAFSNEAGAGSASIAHSAVKTKYAASEGIVALLEPFIDTVVICTMTALVIIMYNSGGIFEYGSDVVINGEKVEGAVLTSMAFADAIPWFPIVLTIAIILFAISTMISWSYYGLQSWMYLFGKSKISDLTYKILFLLFIVIGAAANMDAVWGFSDAMILALIFPNMIGLFFLFPVVKKELSKYLDAIRNK